MTKIRRKGITSMSGKSGNATYSNSPYNKRDFIERALPDRKSGSSTEKQLKQQSVFRGYLDLEAILAESLPLGFPPKSNNLQGRQLFKKENAKVGSIKSVVNSSVVDGKTVTEYAYEVDYERLIIAAGSLKFPSITCVKNTETPSLTFTNKVPGVFGYECNATDNLYAVVYDTGEGMSELVRLGTRGEDTPVVYNLPAEFDIGRLQVYVFATLENGKRASNSRHLSLGA